MGMMNNITKTLKETFKPKQRRAAIGGILGPIMIVVIVIAGVGVLAAMFFDLADTASIVDSIELSNQAVYTDQGFVTVQVKNGGNTGIDAVHAKLLVSNAAGGSVANCGPGTAVLLITPTVIAAAAVTAGTETLNPGDSVTISGGLQNVGAITTNPTAIAFPTIATGPVLTCNGPTPDNLQDRGEYILQITGSSGDDEISKTVTVRAQ